jgi:uncharacterized membrane protein (UPF0136 family)
VKRSIAIFFLLALAGCRHAPVPDVVPTDPAPMVGEQRKANEAIKASANRIGVLNRTNPDPTARFAVDVEVTTILKELEGASWEKVQATVKKLVGERDAALEANAGLQQQITDLKNAERKKQVAMCRWFGFGALAIAALLAYLKLGEWSLVSGGVGLLSLGLAQLLSQPWFTTALNCALGVAAVWLGAAAWRSYRRNTLAAEAAAELDRVKSTLTTLVPAVDSALESLNEAAKSTVRAALSRFMDSDHKKLVKEIRAKL